MRYLLPILTLVAGLALGSAVAPAAAGAPDPCAPTATATSSSTPTATSSSTPTAPSSTPGSTYLPFVVVYDDALRNGWSRTTPAGWGGSYGMAAPPREVPEAYAGPAAWKISYGPWGAFQLFQQAPVPASAITLAVRGDTAGQVRLIVGDGTGVRQLAVLPVTISWATHRVPVPSAVGPIAQIDLVEHNGVSRVFYLDEIALEGQAAASPTPIATSVPATPSATRTPAPAGGTVRIMPLGDSITEGGAGGYRVVLWERLTAAGWSVDFVGPKFDPYTTTPDKDHAGTPGFNTGNILDNLDGYLSTYQPDIVLLLIGTNDLSWWTADLAVAATTAARVGLIIDQVRASGATVYLATTPPARGGNVPIINQDRAQLVRDYNAQLRQLANERGVTLVDVEAGLGLADLADDVHPTAAGYAKIGELWATAMTAP